MSTNQKRLKITIQYDGTDFCGWQIQPGLRTVQGEIEQALQKIHGKRITVIGSGRTDSGVHALEQVAHFDLNSRLSPDEIKRAVNGLTGADLFVLEIEEVHSDFHARFDATARSYRYRIINQPYPLLLRFSHYYKLPLDLTIMQNAAKLLCGKHSFKSFCRKRPGESEYLCIVESANLQQTNHGYEFCITANRYFHQMVRGLVGPICDVGRGALSISEFKKILDYPKENAIVNFLPAKGLILEKIRYSS